MAPPRSAPVAPPSARRFRVLRRVALEQLALGVVPGEEEEHDRRAEQDRDDAGGVGLLVAVEERLLRGRDDRVGVRGVLARGVRGARERVLELLLEARRD